MSEHFEKSPTMAKYSENQKLMEEKRASGLSNQKSF